MTAPYAPPTRPAIDATELTPKQWRQYLLNARKALHEDPRDHEALQAIQDANTALSGYDAAEAASPMERIKAGISGGAQGLADVPGDIVGGLVNTVLHPIETVKGLPKMPGAIARGISSDDPEQVARTVGNIGALLLPAAKVSPKGSFSLAESGALAGPTVGSVMMEALKKPFQIGGRVGRIARNLTRLVEDAPQGVRGALSKSVTPLPPQAELEAELSARATPPMSPDPDAALAIRDFNAGKISETDLQDALDFARGDRLPPAQLPLEPHASPISKGPPGSASLRAGEQATPIPGSEGRGFEITGTRATPPIPRTPTLLEMQQGITEQGMARGEGVPVNHWSSTKIGVTPGPEQAEFAERQAAGVLRGMPFKALRTILEGTTEGSPMRGAILDEYLRRGITPPARGSLP